MQERLERENKERQERMEEKERQERMEEKERQERMEEKERQERMEEKERQERLQREEKEYEFEIRKLELQVKLGSDYSAEKSSAKFDVTKHIKFVPPFQQADVGMYFLHFEKVAGNLKWPKEYWVMPLQSVLIGKAREMYIQLDVEQASNYDNVKELILKGYELVPELTVKSLEALRNLVAKLT